MTIVVQPVPEGTTATAALRRPAAAEKIAQTTAPVTLVPGDGRRTLIGLDRQELEAEMAALGEKPFRAKQLWHWMYFRGARDFDDMTNVPKAFRAKLAEHFVIGRPEVTTDQLSSDGTAKWLLRFADGREVETVHIPDDGRGALCVSSQVGCTLTCKFCHTGTQTWVRNLSAAEITAQMLVARDRLGEWPTPTDANRLISNIVLMGMGEPLYNFDAVAKAMRIVMDGEGVALSRRRITLSTSGVVPMMQRCGEELGVNLAVSLHAVTDDVRDMLVPINRKYPIAELMEACRTYPAASNARRITFEYVMLKGVNDSLADARELVRLLDGIPAKVNLIPFNPWPGSTFECSSWTQIRNFATYLNDQGYSSPVRTPRGRDILAACGQLKSASERARKSREAVPPPEPEVMDAAEREAMAAALALH
ncbi:23S rRNA (adenine(2503)-C(2))-methyltransferase RlmN [Tistrella mobilis]|uniref:23S rRNA (adenine(2503)-C(2))-methyltransferase RlmN n=1 Tax=Tistrella mobilis TaxID=171437 RepID=UPI0035564D55